MIPGLVRQDLICFPDMTAEIVAIEMAAHGVSIRQAAIQFAGMHPAVVSVVLGAVTPEEMVDNVRDAEVPIPPALWAEMKTEHLLDPAAPTPA